MFVAIPTFASVADGYAASFVAGSRPLPFIVRQAADFAAKATVDAVRTQIRREREVYGYSRDGCTHKCAGASAVSAWEARTLDFNIIDSSSTRGSSALLPESIAALNRLISQHECNVLAYVLTLASPVCGALHQDPPYGSNWQVCTRIRALRVGGGKLTVSLSFGSHSQSLRVLVRLSLLCFSS